jgi:aspartate/methionine/tyrosine aminotransferase
VENLALLLQYCDHPNSQEWAELLADKDPGSRLAIVQKLLPDVFLSKKAARVHANLRREYPELLDIAKGTACFFTAFPSTGIPAQSKAITAAGVAKDFNAGIGVAKDDEGNVLINPELAALFDLLKPEGSTDAEWLKVRNQVFNYNDGLGTPWYRELARKRYLLDGASRPALQAQMQSSLNIKPLPVYGGTTALSIAFELGVGEGCPLIFPSTYWDNMDLKAEHQRSRREVCEYIDRRGRFHPEDLKDHLQELRKRGFYKAAVYFNFPHNPTGIVPSESVCLRFQGIIQEMADVDFKIVVICDEPYYPFVRGNDAVRVPFSYYMQPGENRNVLTFVSINGTKRDGMYGLRHSDFMVLTPTNISKEGVNLFEKELLSGYVRGTFSFSDALNQYLLGRAMTDDPFVVLKKSAELVISEAYLAEESLLINRMADKVKKLEKVLDSVEGIRLVRDEEHDCAGGFFLSYEILPELAETGVRAKDIHRAGLQVNCGLVATGGYIRINGLINEQKFVEFADNLRKAIEIAKAGYREE